MLRCKWHTAPTRTNDSSDKVRADSSILFGATTVLNGVLLILIMLCYFCLPERTAAVISLEDKNNTVVQSLFDLDEETKDCRQGDARHRWRTNRLVRPDRARLGASVDPL